MSDIPVSTVVRVTITTAPTFPSRKGFGTLLIIGPSDIISVAERVRVYGTIDEVAADFNSTTEENAAATTYFSQSPAPEQLIIGRRAATAQAAQLRGGSNIATLAALKAVTTGSLKLTIDGVTQEVTAITLAAATDLANVASLLQTKIRAANVAAGYASATVTFDGTRFLLSSGTTGPTSTIGFSVAAAAGTDLTPLLQWGQTTATKGNGVAVETAVAAAQACQDASADWYGLAYTRELRDNAQLDDVAAWVEARVKVFGVDSDDRGILDTLTTSDIASRMYSHGYRRTMTCLNYQPTEYLAISALARAFVVNFGTQNSTITLKFKQMPGISPYPMKTSEKTAMDAKQANAYYTVGGNPMFGESFMAAKGVFFDEVHGIDWLQNAIETNVFGKLYTDTTKTPMTDPGVASLQQKTEQALDEGVYNGLLAPGYDRDGNFLQKGYITQTIPMKDWNQSSKEARQAPPITFVCLGAGAIHGIEINGTFQR